MKDERWFRRELEAAEVRRMESLGRLARNFIHDLNHISAVVKGFSAFIERDARRLSEGDANALNKIHESVAAILDTVDHADSLSLRLLEFSRTMAIETGMCYVNTEVREVAEMLRFPDVRVDVDLRLDDGAAVPVPSPRLRQVLLNLAFNARDAMPSGGDLYIHTFGIDGRACLRMIDTGTGIEDKIRESVFEPFFTTKAKGEGTGLGLSTVYGVVKGAQGDVRMISAPGEGTDVLITLPLATP